MSKKDVKPIAAGVDIDKILSVNDPVPFMSSVQGDVLLDELVGLVRDYVVVDEPYAVALALWVVQTYCYNNFSHSPLLIINAPEKACGKSVALGLVAKLVPRPLECANITLAALFRIIQSKRPTLLIDEADTFLDGKTELAGILNKGYEPGGVVLRTEQAGDIHQVVAYQVYSPKALAGISLERHLPDATMSRGIHVAMRRKVKGEEVKRLRSIDPTQLSSFRSRIHQFVKDCSVSLRSGQVEMPEEFSDREQDNWEPLLCIAAAASEAWFTRARNSALAIKSATVEPQSMSNNLLNDVREVLGGFDADRIPTSQLLDLLTQDPDMGWSSFNKGFPLTPRQLATHLKTYGIQPKTVRMSSVSTPKGYLLREFDDVFNRYLKPLDVEEPVTDIECAVVQTQSTTVSPAVANMERIAAIYLAESKEAAVMESTNANSPSGESEDADF